jgi:hypothetical protein
VPKHALVLKDEVQDALIVASAIHAQQSLAAPAAVMFASVDGQFGDNLRNASRSRNGNLYGLAGKANAHAGAAGDLWAQACQVTREVDARRVDIAADLAVEIGNPDHGGSTEEPPIAPLLPSTAVNSSRNRD